MKNPIDLFGRILIGLFFFFEAFDTMVYFEETIQTLSSYGITWMQEVLVVGSIILLLIGAMMVLIGYYASVGAMLLFLYWFVFTLVVYSFWNDPIGESKNLHIRFFMRNMALCGGLLILAANGAKDWGVKRIFHVLRLPK